MTLLYDCLYFKADEKIDEIKDYLNSLQECDLDKISLLIENLNWFIKHYVEYEVNNEKT